MKQETKVVLCAIGALFFFLTGRSELYSEEKGCRDQAVESVAKYVYEKLELSEGETRNHESAAKQEDEFQYSSESDFARKYVSLFGEIPTVFHSFSLYEVEEVFIYKTTLCCLLHERFNVHF